LTRPISRNGGTLEKPVPVANHTLIRSPGEIIVGPTAWNNFGTNRHRDPRRRSAKVITSLSEDVLVSATAPAAVHAPSYWDGDHVAAVR
jgi:hypothetical protein